MADTTGNLLTSIRNAELANRQTANVPNAKFSLAVLDILKQTGYIAGYSTHKEDKKSFITVDIAQPIVRHTYKRISKPGRRLYTSSQKIPTILRGFGMVIISTSKGVMTGKEARKQKLGGELICEVS